MAPRTICPFIIKKLELEDEFDYIADAAKVKNSKPAADIYLAAAEGLKLDPSVCIGIEDAEARQRLRLQAHCRYVNHSHATKK